MWFKTLLGFLNSSWLNSQYFNQNSKQLLNSLTTLPKTNKFKTSLPQKKNSQTSRKLEQNQVIKLKLLLIKKTTHKKLNVYKNFPLNNTKKKKDLNWSEKLRISLHLYTHSKSFDYFQNEFFKKKKKKQDSVCLYTKKHGKYWVSTLTSVRFGFILQVKHWAYLLLLSFGFMVY